MNTTIDQTISQPVTSPANGLDLLSIAIKAIGVAKKVTSVAILSLYAGFIADAITAYRLSVSYAQGSFTSHPIIMYTVLAVVVALVVFKVLDYLDCKEVTDFDPEKFMGAWQRSKDVIAKIKGSSTNLKSFCTEFVAAAKDSNNADDAALIANYLRVLWGTVGFKSTVLRGFNIITSVIIAIVLVVIG